MAPKGRPVFWSIFDHQNRSFEWRDILFGSPYFGLFDHFSTTKIVPLSGETYFLDPNFGDFRKKCSFLDHFGNPKSIYASPLKGTNIFGLIFDRTDARTDGHTDVTNGRTSDFFGLSTNSLYTIAPSGQ